MNNQSILSRRSWCCKGCEFRPHCDRIVHTSEALPCEKYSYIDENPALYEQNYRISSRPAIDAGALYELIS